MTVPLNEVLAGLTPDPAGGLGIAVPASWNQGRTLYGGLTTALCSRAARLALDDLGPLRSLQIAFIAPAIGQLRYVPTVLRRGRSVTYVSVDSFAGDELGARATLVYGQPRDSPLRHARRSAPDVPAPEACPELPGGIPGAPVFLAQMELRFAAGSPPMSAGEPEFAMWARHRHISGLDAETSILGIADVLPPAVLGAGTEFRPASSMNWMVDLTGPVADPGGWYLLHSSSEHAGDGYSHQTMSCFGADGALLAVGRQVCAIF